MKPTLKIPTGPIHSFVALAHPLPETARQRLRRLSAAIHDAEKDAKPAALRGLDEYVLQLRDAIGFEHVRREWA